MTSRTQNHDFSICLPIDKLENKSVWWKTNEEHYLAVTVLEDKMIFFFRGN